MKKSNPAVSLIIVHYHVEHELINLLRSLEKSLTYEIIVVDNDEKPHIEKSLQKEFPQITYIKNNKNLGFSKANNIGAMRARGDYLFFINPDTIIEKGTIKKLRDFLDSHKKVGVAAPLLYHPDGTIFEKQGVEMLTPLRALFSTSLIHRIWPTNPIAKKYWHTSWNKKMNREVGVVPGTALMLKKELFEKVGGFDEEFFLYFEEFDLCRRITKLGYKLFMVTDTKVTHFWGVSTQKHEKIKEIFRESQDYYFKKYYGKVVSTVLSWLLHFGKYDLLLITTLLIGLVLRVYRITDLFMFIGDFGWFYLSAYDLITKGIIPLVSIPSSVVWIHQGPLATYFIAISLWVGRLNPVAPALFFSLLDVITIYFMYVLGRKIAHPAVGLSAAFLYATSPLVLINVRMPYHTSPIPFFVTSVFLLLLKVIEKKKYYFALFFLTGLLLQLELSNSIVLMIIALLFVLYRKEIRLTTRNFLESVAGFLLGIAPFILYDITHHFTQTLGFPLWVVNRVRLFLGLTTSGNATTGNLPLAGLTIWEHIARILFPYSEIVVGFLLLLIIFTVGWKIWKTKKTVLQNKSLTLVLLWIFIPLLSFLIHAAPGDAYFPFLFPAFALLLAYTLHEIFQRKLLLLFLITFILGSFNAAYTISQDYFLSTFTGVHYMPPKGYGFGPAFFIQEDVANAIVHDADGEPVTLRMGGYQGTVKTGGDQFRYLLLEKGIAVLPEAGHTYMIYESKKDVPKKFKFLFQNKYYFVTKTESKE